MKVLLVNHPDCLRFQGGDLVQMRQTARALAELGVATTESFDPAPDAAGCDLAHVFNLRTVPATLGQVRHLKSQGVPVVLSPIYLDPGPALWGTAAITALFQVGDEAALPRRLEELRRRELRVALPGGTTLTAAAANRPLPDYDRLQRDTLALVDHLVPNSLLEMHALASTLRVHAVPFTAAPYGVDGLTFLDPDPAPFVRRHGRRDFVLQVGRIERSKNQLMLCWALRDAGLPLVLIGHTLQPDYLAWCKKYGPRDLLVVDRLPPAELASAYAAARVHALPSWIETCGLVSLEAALAGCSIVASTAGYEMEYLQNLADWCDPADAASIRAAVARAWTEHAARAERRLRLKERILHQFTWQHAARACHSAYRQVLSHKPPAPATGP